jgi:hypothetical protein
MWLNLTNSNGTCMMRCVITVKQVRAADKFCVDVMCILLLLGLCAVLYAVIKNGV